MKVIVYLILSLAYLSSAAQPIESKSTFEINGTKFKVDYYEIDDDFQVTISSKSGKDWVIQLTDKIEIFGNIKFSLSDINNDRYLDIVVGFAGYMGRQHLYLFDPDQNKYVEVEGYENYGNPQRVKSSSHYFYSYNRMGCDGKVWHSHLFHIHEQQVEVIATIHANGCAGVDNIQVLSVNQDKKSTIVEMSLRKSLEPFNSGKYGFLNDYWAKNLDKFRHR